jgi:GNAT superfamily N-acetyltransferase
MLAVETTHLKQPNKTECNFRLAHPDDASEIVESYESVFGKGGVRAPGHEPYPAPEVFSEDGVLTIIADADRDFLIAECDSEIAGGMIVTHTSPFHREFGCVSVRKNFQGKGISSRMLSYQKEVERRCSLVVNTTEIVTHSMLSQAAHNHAGYNKITGFGYCQYPNVFFKHAPESCLWISSLEGKVVEWLRASRPLSDKSRRESSPKFSTPRRSTPKLPELNDSERDLVKLLERSRKCYVPPRYLEVVSSLLAQFDDTLSYRIFAEGDIDLPYEEQTSVQIDSCTGQPYAYLHFAEAALTDSGFDEAWRAITATGKRYVQARLPMNHPSTILNINLLLRKGFVFLGIAPLFNFQKDPLKFNDVFIMQWVSPDIIRRCPLPGATESVAKLYGYPINLTGDVIEAIRKDLLKTSF